MTPSAYRRETEAIERDALRIKRVREQLQADLAALDRAASVVPQHLGSQENADV